MPLRCLLRFPPVEATPAVTTPVVRVVLRARAARARRVVRVERVVRVVRVARAVLLAVTTPAAVLMILALWTPGHRMRCVATIRAPVRMILVVVRMTLAPVQTILVRRTVGSMALARTIPVVARTIPVHAGMTPVAEVRGPDGS